MEWILASATTGSSGTDKSQTRDHLIYDQVFRYKRYEPGPVCYVGLQLAAQVPSKEIIHILKRFLVEWTTMIEKFTDLALVIDSNLARKCSDALRSMQKKEGWEGANAELNKFLGSLEKFCDTPEGR